MMMMMMQLQRRKFFQGPVVSILNNVMSGGSYAPVHTYKPLDIKKTWQPKSDSNFGL